MRLGKRIARKTLHLPPYFGVNRFGIAPFLAVLGKCIGNFPERFGRTEFARHAPAQYVGIGRIQAREMMCNLDYIFLIHHYAVGFLEQFFHFWMDVAETSGMMEPLDVLAHHARTRNTRTNNRTGGNQRDEIFAFQLAQ